MGGYNLPAGTHVFINFWAIHHNPVTFPDPFSYQPERYLGEDGQVVAADHPARANLFAFGAGPRVCVGETLALTRIFLVLATLLQRFHFLPATTLREQVTCDAREYVNGLALMPQDFQLRLKERI